MTLHWNWHSWVLKIFESAWYQFSIEKTGYREVFYKNVSTSLWKAWVKINTSYNPKKIILKTNWDIWPSFFPSCQNMTEKGRGGIIIFLQVVLKCKHFFILKGRFSGHNIFCSHRLILMHKIKCSSFDHHQSANF